MVPKNEVNSVDKKSIIKNIARIRQEIQEAQGKSNSKDKLSIWADVPEELNKILTSGRVDAKKSESVRISAESFLLEAELDDTQLVSTLCTDTMCRADFKHKTVEDFEKYDKANTAYLWFEGPAYFSRRSNKDGTSASSLWFGRDGNELPIRDILSR